ncbi:glyoxalase [Frankia sp. CNm7]|uniref:Glyoxalase n=1 Tax=Frankia nepalensis TaxID=1836974 RepID=A0A937RF79_9ACTN|nr:VOC family protein [Frankia nepalensis]MBL7497621.1 glyoxalase [Frankia nepalensis]MBL7510065.1 glyoxalase [Frankia nepalensis]MBL7519065.1 glyoxalase [Frankia nepalensis]MBL7631086.1 glyoxalase [Frankia nepalensis]
MTNTRTDHNIWTGLTYDDPRAARAWLVELGFAEGIVVAGDDGQIHHSEMLWPEGGRVMISSRGRADDTFAVPRGAASVYVVVDDPDEVHARARALGAEIVRDLADEDYGSRGFSVADAEGNRWSFGTYAG